MTIFMGHTSTLRQSILDQFKGRCLICFRRYSHFHHIEPKSLRPTDYEAEDNIVLLCDECHEDVHADGAVNHIDYLKDLRKRRLGQSNI